LSRYSTGRPPTDTSIAPATRRGVGASSARSIGLLLFAGVAAGFLLAAIGMLAILPAWAFQAGVLVGATSSLLMLVAFFHPWLIAGIGIDVALLWTTFFLGWGPAD
jgi:hypothetical protein